MPIKYCLLLLLGAFFTLPSNGDLIDFHFGAVTQTGSAVLGNTGDFWNSSNVTNGGPILLQNIQGAASAVSVSWTSGDAWVATKAVYSNTTSTSMDAATSELMRSFISSYQYGSGATNLALNFSGLSPKQPYTLVLFGAGDQIGEGTRFTISGNGTFTGATSGHNRRISGGAGDAYATISVISSDSGSLKISTMQNGYHYAVLNGFQLNSSTTSTASTPPPAMSPPPAVTLTSSGSSSSTASKGSTRSIAWGVCGHPTWSDYANWVAANRVTQMTYLQQLGAKYYRCSFEGGPYPSILDSVVPAAQSSGITVLPILPLSLKPANTAQSNHDTNYQTAYTWATYAISKNYALPYWELGNELENWDLVDVVYDGASANDFPDKTPGGFVAIASGLSGAYQGIKDAYTAGRQSGLTTITPQILYGACYRHWGLLTKIQSYNGSLPCDIISWHWYGPNYGPFNLPISDSNSVSNGRTPAQCLNDFKSHTNPSQPMDIWITETNRSQKITGGALLNGSTGSNTAPQAYQDWAAEGQAIQTNVDSFKAVPTVKGIFVYELFDETLADKSSTSLLASEGYFGLVTGLNGVLKTAFYTYQTEIKQGP
jgi:hypothetical protein